jgi:glutamate racemase
MIGLFDSGAGGLTVAKELMELMPNERLVYYGDTARLPYGSKTTEQITEYSFQIINFLIKKGVRAVVVACGTVSANCMDTIRSAFDIPIFDVMTHGVELAKTTTQNGIIGVVATERTVASKKYSELLNGNKVIEIACPLFVPLIEKGTGNGEYKKALQDAAEEYLRPIVNHNADTLILGCTHYPLIENIIREVVGDINIINLAVPCAEHVRDNLEPITDSSPHMCYVSGDVMQFDIINKQTLDLPLKPITPEY